MEKLITQEVLLKSLEGISKIQEEIRKFLPIVEGELKSLSESDYMSKVCNSHIDYKIRKAKEGDILFNCNYFHNKRYFDKINRPQNSLGFIEDKAEIEVNVAGLSKFIMNCPRAGEFLCKLRYFIESEIKKEKEEI